MTHTKKQFSFLSQAANILTSRFSHKTEIRTMIRHALLSDDPAKKFTENKKRYQKSGLTEQKLDGYESTLIGYIEKSRVFLDPELTLEGLSFDTKIPKHHITQLLNDRIRKNFYCFINEYRIREAALLLKDEKQNNLLSLAFDCGFNSKSSFNNYFRKFMQETPSSYRNRFYKASES